jgi:hypothetical protein
MPLSGHTYTFTDTSTHKKYAKITGIHSHMNTKSEIVKKVESTLKIEETKHRGN